MASTLPTLMHSNSAKYIKRMYIQTINSILFGSEKI